MTNNSNSRLNKFEKRRRNTKFINYSLILASVLVLFLVAMWIFGGGEDEVAETTDAETAKNESLFLEVDEDDEEQENESNDSDQVEDIVEDSEDQADDEKDNNEEAEDEDQEVTTVEAEPSDDNVSEAVTGNWPAIGTSQTGPHTTNFENGSQDRIEIKKAVSMVTGIPEDNMIEWWVGNGGDQKVVATVSDREETETYRVYLSWVDNEGWQPTKLETLVENDKK